MSSHPGALRSSVRPVSTGKETKQSPPKSRANPSSKPPVISSVSPSATKQKISQGSGSNKKVSFSPSPFPPPSCLLQPTVTQGPAIPSLRSPLAQSVSVVLPKKKKVPEGASKSARKQKEQNKNSAKGTPRAVQINWCPAPSQPFPPPIQKEKKRNETTAKDEKKTYQKWPLPFYWNPSIPPPAPFQPVPSPYQPAPLPLQGNNEKPAKGEKKTDQKLPWPLTFYFNPSIPPPPLPPFQPVPPPPFQPVPPPLQKESRKNKKPVKGEKNGVADQKQPPSSSSLPSLPAPPKQKQKKKGKVAKGTSGAAQKQSPAPSQPILPPLPHQKEKKKEKLLKGQTHKRADQSQPSSAAPSQPAPSLQRQKNEFDAPRGSWAVANSNSMMTVTPRFNPAHFPSLSKAQHFASNNESSFSNQAPPPFLLPFYIREKKETKKAAKGIKSRGKATKAERKNSNQAVVGYDVTGDYEPEPAICSVSATSKKYDPFVDYEVHHSRVKPIFRSPSSFPAGLHLSRLNKTLRIKSDMESYGKKGVAYDLMGY